MPNIPLTDVEYLCCYVEGQLHTLVIALPMTTTDVIYTAKLRDFPAKGCQSLDRVIAYTHGVNRLLHPQGSRPTTSASCSFAATVFATAAKSDVAYDVGILYD